MNKTPKIRVPVTQPLNFFVTLVNTIGVPVILIGTTKAMPILQGEFRQARRGSGQGDLIWDRLKNDRTWEIIIKAMWKNQWTKHPVPLSDELKNTIYDESQGIIDIAIKLYAMSQMEAIVSRKERITPEIIRKVAREKLVLVKPMLDALKSGNIKEIIKYSDIRPVNIDAFRELYEEQLLFPREKDFLLSKEEQSNESGDIFQQAVLRLLDLEFDLETARQAVQRVVSTHNAEKNVALIVREALKIVLKQGKQRGRPKKVALNGEHGDLRSITKKAEEMGRSPYEALKAEKVIKHPDEDFLK